ncbi:heavy-metal-associated domain-containing protein [Stackebrandtia nassauensis]|uniref:heavy-metal-associated domain-containing protein n=1 Tax=Stackebrandtia nassauensis TaxID=283811 RepID=UPI0001A39867|nr:heavy-metal-associated domain-containing protein [Stackebrandtia nassauensis]
MCDTCSTTPAATTTTVTTGYAVTGMTCGHCATSVTNELNRVPGVETVSVDVEGGTVTIGSTTALDDEAVRAAVDEAGYQLTGKI